ncbi:hypothetical protein BD770DRAFT_441252 [Pilaira anomala]|nr:hypothetical protein BD770DRAFT_441252 [Pilaira anomala]
MLLLPIICYFITAVSYVFPPLAPLFEEYKSAYCTSVPTISSVPAWNNKKASPPEVCKSVTIMADLFYKASPIDVCYPVLEKGLSVVFPFPPPVLPICSASVSSCKPDYTSGLFKLQAYNSTMVLSKEIVRKLVGLPTEDEVAACLVRISELKEKVVLKEKYHNELKDAFVKISQEAAFLEGDLSKKKALIDGLSQQLKIAKTDAQEADNACLEAFDSNFVTMTKLKNENDSLYKKIHQ